MNTYTIGFTQKGAESFFTLLKQSSIKTLIDVRLNNRSQLSGFAKKDDLRFFLRELCDTDYLHLPELAPTQSMLNGYKKQGVSWEVYEEQFLNLMAQRQIEQTLSADLFDQSCLLCSEHQPHFCHRRLVVEYLNSYWNATLNIKHLY